jgi:hypothetical protein
MRFSFLLLATLALSAAPLASAQDIHDATNQQLLNELARRLQGGGGGWPSDEAGIASYYCDSYTLTIRFLPARGSETSTSLNLSNSGECTKRVQQVGNKTRITQRTIVAGCDSYTLYRVLLDPRDGISSLPTQSLSNSSDCDREATRLNTSAL